MSKFLIYALHHDNSDRIYIGRSSSGLKRGREHGYPSHLKNFEHYPVSRWIVARRQMGEDYQIAVLEEHYDPSTLNEAEMFYIAYFRSIGMQLLNCTDGGERISNKLRSPAHCENISRALRGKPKSEKERERLRALSKRSDLIEKRIAASRTPEAIAKRKNTCAIAEVRESMRHTMSIDARKRQSKRLRGVPRSVETCEKVSRAKLGVSCSSETRKKVSDGLKRYFAQERLRQIPRIRLNLLQVC